MVFFSSSFFSGSREVPKKQPVCDVGSSLDFGRCFFVVGGSSTVAIIKLHVGCEQLHDK